VEKAESLTVTIPVGAEEGMALRLAGRGMASPAPGGLPGDLFVVLRAREDSRFIREGADLWRQEQVRLPDAVLGTQLKVPTLEGGQVEVDIPPGTQPDTVLRLRGKGLPHFGGAGKGDMYLRVKVRIPTKLSREEKELYARLQALAGPRKPLFRE
jgi:molecular chaperone DnaJ